MKKFKREPMHFLVEGRGQFPFDMLRYDSCWPYTSKDAELIDAGFPAPTELRRVGLRSHWEPTKDRWASFGWRVVS